jgi:hypothetical protein
MRRNPMRKYKIRHPFDRWPLGKPTFATYLERCEWSRSQATRLARFKESSRRVIAAFSITFRDPKVGRPSIGFRHRVENG